MVTTRPATSPPEGDIRYEQLACYLFMSPSYWHAHQIATKAISRARIQARLPAYFPEVESTYAALGSVYDVEFDDWWQHARAHFGFGDRTATPLFAIRRSTIDGAALWWRLKFLRAVGGKRTQNHRGELVAHQARLTHARIWEWFYQTAGGRDVEKGTIKPSMPDPDYAANNEHWRTERPRRRDMNDSYVREIADKSARKALRLAFNTAEWAARGCFPSTAPLKFDGFSKYLLTPELQRRIRAQSAKDLDLERADFRAAHPGEPVRIAEDLHIEGTSRNHIQAMVDGFTIDKGVDSLKLLRRRKRLLRIAPNKMMLRLLEERAKREGW
jgi:hypothetical protein